MKQMKQFLSMAALAIVGTIMSCTSSDEISAGSQPETKTITQTITLSLDDDDASTRGFDIKTGKKRFYDSDTICVFYRQEPGYVSWRAFSQPPCQVSADGQKATFTVALENPKKNSPIRIVYRSSMMGSPATNEEVDFTNDNLTLAVSSLQQNQNGRGERVFGQLATFDVATYDGTLNGTSLPENVALRNRMAILALTVKNGGTDITNTIKDLKINDGFRTYDVQTKEFHLDTIYVAMFPVDKTQTLTIIAEDLSSNHYMKVVTGKELKRSNIYPVNLTMTKLTPKVLADGNYTASNNDIISGHSNNCTITIPDGATVMLNDVNKGQLSNNTYIKCQGSANIIFTGENHLNAPDGSNHPAIFVPQNKSLSISGTGSLTVKSKGGAGIGAGHKNLPCGDINILGGDINASSTTDAGIGAGGAGSTCGKINIIGGNIEAAADNGASAAIGGGSVSGSTKITITSGVNSLTVKGGDNRFICNSSGGVVGNVTIDGKTSFTFTTSDTQFDHFKSVLKTEGENSWNLTHK